MAVSAANWNCVIVGRWNRGILTPAGIAKRLFGLEEGTPIEINVPIDYLVPMRVKYSGISVVVDETRLIIEVEEKSFIQMKRALELAKKAIDSLPETPLAAVGINFRYTISNPPEILLRRLQLALDEDISDCSYTITQKGARRRLKFNDGHINMEILEGVDGNWDVVLNFERVTERHNDIKAWLSLPIDCFKEEVQKIKEKILHMESEDGSHDC